jgi:RNA recognition motif-containing protein
MIKEMCKRVVFVKNLPKVISIDEVKELFDKYGEVAEVRFRPPSPKPLNSLSCAGPPPQQAIVCAF